MKTEVVEKYKLSDLYPHLLPEDISQAVLYVLGTPERVQVFKIIITIKSCCYLTILLIQVHELTISPVGSI